ncbi:Uncharacterised protein [Klebsiella pneumoniae]|nr:Uncharacterised protein [Klebsiella pneumoniae]
MKKTRHSGSRFKLQYLVIVVVISAVDQESYHPFNHYIIKSLTFYSFTFGGYKGTTTYDCKLNVS